MRQVTPSQRNVNPRPSKSRKLMPGAIERNPRPAQVCCVRCVIDLGPGNGTTGAEANSMYKDGVRKYEVYSIHTRSNPVRRKTDRPSALLCWIKLIYYLLVYNLQYSTAHIVLQCYAELYGVQIPSVTLQ